MADPMLERATEKSFAGYPTRDEPDVGAEWLSRFVRQMRDEGRVGSSTLDAYTFDIRLLVRWSATERKTLLALDSCDLARYLKERLGQGTRASTLGRQLSSWRCFYAFLVRQGVLEGNPTASVCAPEVPRREPRGFPESVITALLRPEFSPDAASASAYRARRDHAIVWTLYAADLSVSDVRLLRWLQIDEQVMVIHVPIRNRTTRRSVLDARSLSVLRELRTCAATAGAEQEVSPYCFPTASGLPMSRQGLCHVVRRWARESGVKEVVTPSMLRQSGRPAKRRVPAAGARGEPGASVHCHMESL